MPLTAYMFSYTCFEVLHNIKHDGESKCIERVLFKIWYLAKKKSGNEPIDTIPLCIIIYTCTHLKNPFISSAGSRVIIWEG